MIVTQAGARLSILKPAMLLIAGRHAQHLTAARGRLLTMAGASSQGVPAPSPFAFVPVTELCTICLASNISFIAGCFE